MAVFEANGEKQEWVGSTLLFLEVKEWEGAKVEFLNSALALVRWYPEPKDVTLCESPTVGRLSALMVEPSWDDDDTSVGVMAVKDMCGLVGLGELEGGFMVLGRRLVRGGLMGAS